MCFSRPIFANMKNHLKVVVSFLVALILVACGGKPETKETPKGYKFQVVKSGDGNEAKVGEVVMMEMRIVDPNDSVWYDNKNQGYPEMVRIQPDSLKASEYGIVEAFRMISKGDSIVFPMKAEDMFTIIWRQPVPPNIDPKSDFKFLVKCTDVTTDVVATKMRRAMDSTRYMKEMEAMKLEEAGREEYNKTALGRDTVIIDNFLKSKNMKALTTKSGLRYIIKKQGSGNPPLAGDIVTIKYHGQLLDGTEFDSGEIPFPVGQQAVIQGWDEIIMMMKPGQSLTVMIPSPLGYGRAGRGTIQPDAIMMFDMELVNVAKP